MLWALGEQSPLAVRGQSMQDVIFAGAHGVQARSEAEVEVVLDNGDGAVDLPAGEVSIARRLDRAGEGEYRVNGAKCRLVDVLEILSDTGLGKEMHSVVSQGRVEAIVTSKPRDRRLLIEEAAGLGKHRKRRRRAQLKLERTQDNLDRALDVENEARSRLRPLKRQAEAAELHERLARQTDEARWTLAREDARVARAELAEAEAEAARREGRVRGDRGRAGEAARRARAGRGGAGRPRPRARGAGQPHLRGAIGGRADRAAARERTLGGRADRGPLAAPPGAAGRAGGGDAATRPRTPAPTSASPHWRPSSSSSPRAGRSAWRRSSPSSRPAARPPRPNAPGSTRSPRPRWAAAARPTPPATPPAAPAARSTAPPSEPAARPPRSAPSSPRSTSSCAPTRARRAERPRSPTRCAPTPATSSRSPPRSGRGCARRWRPTSPRPRRCSTARAATAAPRSCPETPRPRGPSRAAVIAGARPDAQPLLDHVDAEEGAGASGAAAASLARGLLADVWVVESFERLRPDFHGVAVTRDGRVWSPGTRELRQVPGGGEDRLLSERNRRDELVGATERAARAEQAALAEVEQASQAVAAADAARDEADRAAREATRARDEASEAVRHAGWLIEQRRKAPDEGPTATRRAQIASALNAERRLAERAERERRDRERRLAHERGRLAADDRLAPAAQRLVGVLEVAGMAVGARQEALQAELDADRAAGERLAADLRAGAAAENAAQTRLGGGAQAVTRAEVRAQQARDRAHEVDGTLRELAGKLGLEAEPAEEPLPEGERDNLAGRIERLQKRREQLGPVNPLAQDEYAEAIAHVEELEARREDLEDALRELKGLIRDTDKRIREAFEETFTAAAKNFEEVAEQLFPGGRGRLRLVREDAGPRPVLGGAEPEESPSDEERLEAAVEAEESGDPDDGMGVEIEITPAGKSTKRLTLLSGGEKSLTALAFLFAVFLARPCPFYILDEVEAALDDLNIDRFLGVLRRFSDRAQFIVVTHQKRTMEAADCLYGVSMAGNGVSKVVSRRLPPRVAGLVPALSRRDVDLVARGGAGRAG